MRTSRTPIAAHLLEWQLVDKAPNQQHNCRLHKHKSSSQAATPPCSNHCWLAGCVFTQNADQLQLPLTFAAPMVLHQQHNCTSTKKALEQSHHSAATTAGLLDGFHTKRAAIAAPLDICSSHGPPPAAQLHKHKAKPLSSHTTLQKPLLGCWMGFHTQRLTIAAPLRLECSSTSPPNPAAAAGCTSTKQSS